MVGVRLLVAVRARGRLRRAFVRLMTARARLSAVDFDRCERALLFSVTTFAVLRLV